MNNTISLSEFYKNLDNLRKRRYEIYLIRINKLNTLIKLFEADRSRH